MREHPMKRDVRGEEWNEASRTRQHVYIYKRALIFKVLPLLPTRGGSTQTVKIVLLA